MKHPLEVHVYQTLDQRLFIVLVKVKWVVNFVHFILLFSQYSNQGTQSYQIGSKMPAFFFFNSRHVLYKWGTRYN